MTPIVKIDEERQVIVVEVPMCDPKITTSKKSVLIATTRGHKVTDCKFRDLQVAVNVNVYVPNKDN